jgi:outer membrane protein OmpA-like peptidoglycan-associated protein
LSVVYRKGNRPSAETTEFTLDVSAPQADVELSPVPFSPDNDGVDDELTINIDVQDRSPIATWELTIYDRNMQYFTDVSGEGKPASEIIWDGRSAEGDLVLSAEDYPYELTVTDALGNTETVTGEIPVDILVVREDGQLKVRIADITFAPNSSDLIVDPNTERGAKNRAILDRLAEVFAKYERYDIRIEGHAVNVTGTQREEEEELKPLSRNRAQSVKEALVERGLDQDRMSVVGRGGTDPIVPHTDLDNRWKNRRVEFILVR